MQDEFLRRKHWVLLYAQGLAKDTSKHLGKLSGVINSVMPKGDLSALSMTSLNQLVAKVVDAIKASWLAVVDLLDRELLSFMRVEMGAYDEILNDSRKARPTERVVLREFEAARKANYDGKPIPLWLKALPKDHAEKAEKIILAGWASNTKTPEIVEKLTEITGQAMANAEKIVKAAAGQLSNAAIEANYQLNRDILKGKRWLSTLDGRTTLMCMARDGKLYTLDNKPVGHNLEWGAGPGAIHWLCRSTSVPVTKIAEDVGTRAAFDYNQSTKSRATSVIKSPDGEKMGAGEQIDGTIHYGKWLKGQPKWFQDDLLGPKRAQLMRDGGIEIENFTAADGRTLTLDELKARHPKAFKQTKE